MKLIVNFIGTGIFHPLVEFLAAHQRQADYLDPNAVINQLVQAKHMNEAKMVEKACKGQHGKDLLFRTHNEHTHCVYTLYKLLLCDISAGMRTLDAAAGAFSAISRWWRKE